MREEVLKCGIIIIVVIAVIAIIALGINLFVRLSTKKQIIKVFKICAKRDGSLRHI